MRMPKSVRLPFYPKIRIRYVSNRQMRRLYNPAHSNTQCPYGLWHEGAKGGPILYVNRDEPLWVQIDTLYHELKHGLNDAAHVVKENLSRPLEMEAVATAIALEEEDD